VWKSKKVVLLAALAIVMLIASIATGVTFAQSGGARSGAQPGNGTALMDKVCEIYQENTGVALDANQLETAYTQAQTEMRTEAQNGSGNESQPGAKDGVLLDKVVTIYEENTGVTLDAQQLKDALSQAQTEMQTEALQSRFQDLVTQGKITQDQADQYLQWWNSKPDIGIDIPLLGLCGGGNMMMGGRGHDFGGGNSTASQMMPGFGSGNSTVPQTMPGFRSRR
jgi:hypothetical protein